MIYIKVALWPKGDFTKEKILGEATIINQTGGGSLADYSVLISKRGGFSKKSPVDLVRSTVKNVWKRGTVKEYQRNKKTFWYLIYESIKQAI